MPLFLFTSNPIGYIAPPLVQAEETISAPPEKVIIPYELQVIAKCESGGVHEVDGVIVRSSTNDIGLFQINIYYHEKRSRELNIDIYTEEGNTKYALLLFEENGTKPWNPSHKCWHEKLSLL